MVIEFAMPQRAEILGDLHGGVASCFAAPPLSLELQLLQGGDVELAGAGGLHAGYEGLGGGERGGVGDALADGGAAQQGQAAASV